MEITNCHFANVTEPLLVLITLQCVSSISCVFELLMFFHLSSEMQLVQVLTKLFDDYVKTTSQKLKIIDAYMFYILLTGIIQFVYCVLVSLCRFIQFIAAHLLICLKINYLRLGWNLPFQRLPCRIHFYCCLFHSRR